MPQELFLAKPPKQGTLRLPAIYREMAYEIYVDTLDLSVYSAKKGRMWRTPNVKRENGNYKVPLTADEALNMEVGDYAGLCAAPRKPPTPTPPEPNAHLAVLFAKSSAKIEGTAKKRKGANKDQALLMKFGGKFPPSLERVMTGEGTAEGIGFHQIALQIAITANALGKQEPEVLAACDGLLQKHQSDSARYNTAAKRRTELSRLYSYTRDNPCYEYSRDAVRRLVPVGQNARAPPIVMSKIAERTRKLRTARLVSMGERHSARTRQKRAGRRRCRLRLVKLMGKLMKISVSRNLLLIIII